MASGKKGISLITLVITILVMIILTSVIILTLNSTSLIDKASVALEKTNINNYISTKKQNKKKLLKIKDFQCIKGLEDEISQMV